MGKRILGAGLLVTTALVLASGAMAAPQESPTTPSKSGKIKTVVEVGEPGILTPDQLAPDSDSRLVAESFLVAAFTMDGDMVYDTYLHPTLKAQYSREEFKEQIRQLREADGALTRLFLTYLRETPRLYDGVDGGWTEHMLVFERDPRVATRVDFRRTEDGTWRVIHFTFTSQHFDRVLSAREAARKAGEAQESGSENQQP